MKETKIKKLGDTKCQALCGVCPLRAICDGSFYGTLYEILEKFKTRKEYFDQEIYDLLKLRLDKSVTIES